MWHFWGLVCRVNHNRTHMHTNCTQQQISKGKTQMLIQLSFTFNNGSEKEGFHNKQRHLERFWIRLIRFVFCLLFRRHDQSDISAICVSSGEEGEEFGEFCLLISSGSALGELGTVIKTRELWIMKSVDQKMKQNWRFVLYYNKIGLYHFSHFPVSSPLKEGVSQFQCMPNPPCSVWVEEEKSKRYGWLDPGAQSLRATGCFDLI